MLDSPGMAPATCHSPPVLAGVRLKQLKSASVDPSQAVIDKQLQEGLVPSTKRAGVSVAAFVLGNFKVSSFFDHFPIFLGKQFNNC